MTEPHAESPLARFRARRAELIAEQHLDLRVPGYTEPEVFVRYKPVDYDALRESARRRGDLKTTDGEYLHACDTLVSGCVGVFAVVDGKSYALDPDAPDGDWPRFEPRLGEALGVEVRTAVAAVTALFEPRPMAVSDHYERLVAWSRGVVVESDRTLAGE